MDEQRLKESFARVAAYGDEVPLFCYSHLFLGHPELREMFPASMAGQRDKLLNALGCIASAVSSRDALVSFIQGLGRDHRNFETAAGHDPAVGASLLARLAHFNGTARDDLARDWTAAYAVIAQVMTGAAADHDAYICGSTATVRATTDRLRSLGMAKDHVCFEDLGWSEP